MPRDIPVGNGQLLVTFDRHYRIRDLYFPHVGQENHVASPCRFGVWTDWTGTDPYVEKPRARPRPERRRHRVCWSDEGWEIEPRYRDATQSTDVRMTHAGLGVELRCHDTVDFRRAVLVRRIDVRNLVEDKEREVRVFSHQDFAMYGNKVGDTAYFDPQLRSVIHYRQSRYLMASFYRDDQQQNDGFATGNAGFGGAEGTWRDAEDGELGGNPVGQGAVDSTIMTRVTVGPAGGPEDTARAYLVIAAAFDYEGLADIHRFVHRESPQGVIDRTDAYWRLWLRSNESPPGVGAAAGVSATVAEQPPSLPESVRRLYDRSLLLVRTQIDHGGAIIAANDSDIMQFSRDTYSYLWPRDGAFVADAMDIAGFPSLSRRFFQFCAEALHERGMFLHKYNPDGSPASSWHPWVDAQGRPQLPIQEDETALVVWAAWRHYQRHGDVEFARPLWIDLVRPAADFMVRFRDPATGLPLPSYDLWEERYGVHAFTVATVYAGLDAAAEFARAFGDAVRARRYQAAADRMRAAFETRFWSDGLGRFVRRLQPADGDRGARLMGEVFAGRTPRADGDAGPGDRYGDGTGATPGPASAPEVAYVADENIDVSIFAVWALGMLPADDPRVAATMAAVETRLTVKTSVGGVARYEDDYYHQVTDDVANVPGNPWFICTLWMADYAIERAQTADELAAVVPRLQWVADRALPSGVLAEQVHPHTNEPLSVSPLTWSHATFVATVDRYRAKAAEV